jgi:hypothetical protein
MHPDTHANAITGIGIACASLGGLFAQAAPGTVGIWGSVLALALLLVRAAHEIGLRWLALQASKVEHEGLAEKIRELETAEANNKRMASIGYCPLDPGGNGQPACLRTGQAPTASSLPPVPAA